MKISSDINIGNRTRDLPACGTVPQPIVPPCNACYCVSTDIFPDLFISKQSLSLLTEFSYRCVSLSRYLPLKFSVAANVPTLTFIRNNSKHVVRSCVENSAVFAEGNFIFPGITDRRDIHDVLHYASLLRPLRSKLIPHHLVLKSS